MFIDDQKRIIFVHNPKAAGSALHVLLKDLFRLKGDQRSDPEPHLHHRNFQQILDLNPEYRKYYSFAMVRNPWSRLLSGYLDFTQNRMHQYSGQIIFDRPLLSEYENFKDFVMNMENSVCINDVHFLPQHLYTHAGNKSVDIIMRVENYSDDVDNLMNKIGFPNYRREYPHYDVRIHRTTDHGHYTEYYDPESVNKVAQIYAKDIALFGYQYGH